MIHNHEVAGSCPALATKNQEVTKIKFVTSFSFILPLPGSL